MKNDLTSIVVLDPQFAGLHDMKAFVMEKYVMPCAVIDAQLPNYLHLKVAVVRDNPEPLYAEILLPHYAVQFIGLKNPPKKLGFSAETEPVRHD